MSDEPSENIRYRCVACACAVANPVDGHAYRSELVDKVSEYQRTGRRDKFLARLGERVDVYRYALEEFGCGRRWHGVGTVRHSGEACSDVDYAADHMVDAQQFQSFDRTDYLDDGVDGSYLVQMDGIDCRPVDPGFCFQQGREHVFRFATTWLAKAIEECDYLFYVHGAAVRVPFIIGIIIMYTPVCVFIVVFVGMLVGMVVMVLVNMAFVVLVRMLVGNVFVILVHMPVLVFFLVTILRRDSDLSVNRGDAILVHLAHREVEPEAKPLELVYHGSLVDAEVEHETKKHVSGYTRERVKVENLSA